MHSFSSLQKSHRVNRSLIRYGWPGAKAIQYSVNMAWISQIEWNDFATSFFVQDTAKRRRRELVKVENQFKGLVMGKTAAKLQHISAQSGARVILDREDLEIYIISGTEEEREYAKVLIGKIVVSKSCLS